jgi:hypothetical protein
MEIKAANSKYPCIWCKCSKCQFKDIHREFSIIDKQKMARSIEEAEELSKNKQFGYRAIPMSKCFPFHFVIINIQSLFDCCLFNSCQIRLLSVFKIDIDLIFVLF